MSVAIGVKYLGGPLALYRLPRAEQELALAWYCAEHLPEGWRTKGKRARPLRDSVDATEGALSFWTGG